MLKFITPPDAAIFTGLTGIAMVLTGREIGGAIVISASLGAFVFFEWWLYHRQPTKELSRAEAELEERRQQLEQRENAIAEREKRRLATCPVRLPNNRVKARHYRHSQAPTE